MVGLPDEKWGQAVTGVVTLAEGAALDEAALRAHVRQSLAGYKTPKRIFIADRSLRAANGKADYPAAKAAAEAAAAAGSKPNQPRHSTRRANWLRHGDPLGPMNATEGAS